jgi:Ca2+-binding RTX toxin-like protein
MAILIGTSGSDWIDGTTSSDTISGEQGDDILSGHDGDDLLEGGDGSDALDGGAGADDMRGGLGQDIYYVNHAGDLVTEVAGDLGRDMVVVSLASYVLPDHVEDADLYIQSNAALYGNALDNMLTGYWGHDWLEGGAGNDVLFGKSGSDTLVGGTGNDVYLLRAEDDGDFDTVIEAAGGGIDTVDLNLAYYVLPAHVENAAFTEGYETHTVIGNGLSNHFLLGGGAYTIDGAGGTDTADYGLMGSPVEVDLLTNVNGGGAADDTFTGIENLIGTGNHDILRGTNGANILNGAGGADLMEGRGGNDIYLIDNNGDVVIEAAGGGIDEVRVTRHWDMYFMPDEVERLRSTSDALWAWGNVLNNDMIGSAGLETFYGGDGHDFLSGGGGDDTLYGEAGHDTLNGGTGVDRMEGGDGNDAYVVDNAGDEVIEAAGEGPDQVTVSLSAYLLPAEVENMFFAGSGAFAGSGNSHANLIQSSGGNDQLSGEDGDDELRSGSGGDVVDGGEGDDLLVGGGGADVLTGGTGADRFRFGSYESGTGGGADRITDFVSGEDVIELSGIDADFWTPGDQAFSFIGESAFSGAAGELRYRFDGTDGWLEADTDGDGLSDYEIVLSGPVLPLVSDLVL